MILLKALVVLYSVTTTFAFGLVWSTMRAERREVKLWRAFEADMSAEREVMS